MKEEKTKAPQTPLGLPPFVIVGYYLLVLLLTGYPICATEPLKQLMRMNGIFSEYSPADAEDLLTKVTNLGITLSLLGSIVMGLCCDYLGPKITAILGQSCFCAGYAIIFFSPAQSVTMMYLGCGILGGSYMALFTSHISAAALYPKAATLILALLGAAPDLSLCVPQVLCGISSFIGVPTTIFAYCCFSAGIAFLESIMVPSVPFEAPKDEVADAEGGDTTKTGEAAKAPDAAFTGLDLNAQLRTPHFWLFTIYTGFNMFRKVHFLQFVRKIFAAIGQKSGAAPTSVETLVTVYGSTLPFAFIPAIAMGAVTNSLGVVAGLAINNFFGVVLYALSSIPIMVLQWGSIIAFHCLSSYIFGICFAFLANIYGFKTLGTLQGIQLVFASCCASLISPWNDFVVHRMGIITANIILLCISVAWCALPIFYAIKKPEVPKLEESSALIEHNDAEAEVIFTKQSEFSAFLIGGGYDKRSLMSLSNRTSQRKLKV